MSMALALAKIATTELFRTLDQRTKNVISNILIEIKTLCKYDTNLANKLLFDLHYTRHTHNSHHATNGDTDHAKRHSRKHFKLDTESPSHLSNLTSTSTSSWSSLRSTTNQSNDSDSDSSLTSSEIHPDEARSCLNQVVRTFNSKKRFINANAKFC